MFISFHVFFVMYVSQQYIIVYYPIISLVYHSIAGLIRIIYLPNQKYIYSVVFYHDQLLIIKKSQKKKFNPMGWFP